ncbi:hypothetical protein BC832DRAFT_617602 [Gaertneriomyces semiglobifer]|nr:hypothetical protein BC832DRAFT_617602 [Gaertneriomyces semiglobifer]
MPGRRKNADTEIASAAQDVGEGKRLRRAAAAASQQKTAAIHASQKREQSKSPEDDGHLQESTSKRQKRTHAPKGASERSKASTKAKQEGDNDEANSEKDTKDGSSDATPSDDSKKEEHQAQNSREPSKHAGNGSKSVKQESSAASSSTGLKEGKGTLEQGRIYFFYRPKVERTQAESLDDVQRLYIILQPDAAPGGGSASYGPKARLMTIGKKKLPEIRSRARYWGFVAAVADNAKELSSGLEEEKYSTATRGERTVEAARPCGEGVYAIVEHHGHSHLAYMLALPEEPGAVQEAFNIQKQGSFVLSVKNPATSQPANVGLGSSKKAQLPAEIEKFFDGRRFISANPTALLNYKDLELLFIGAADDVVSELGSAGQDLEVKEEEEHKDIVKLEEDSVFQSLELEKKKFKSEPLFGDWA